MDKKQLREKFFKECVTGPPPIKTDGGTSIPVLKVNMSPHDLFEWIWENFPNKEEQKVLLSKSFKGKPIKGYANHVEEPKAGDILALEEGYEKNGKQVICKGEHEIKESRGLYEIHYYISYHIGQTQHYASLSEIQESGVKHRIIKHT